MKESDSFSELPFPQIVQPARTQKTICAMNLRKLKELRCEKAIAEHFVGLTNAYLSNGSSRNDDINHDLQVLVAFCNHHRNTLWRLYRDGTAERHHYLKTWLLEIASPPSGDWAELRLLLSPFIRTFGRLPRQRGSRLFSPLDEDLPVAVLQVREFGGTGKQEVPTVKIGSRLMMPESRPRA